MNSAEFMISMLAHTCTLVLILAPRKSTYEPTYTWLVLWLGWRWWQNSNATPHVGRTNKCVGLAIVGMDGWMDRWWIKRRWRPWNVCALVNMYTKQTMVYRHQMVWIRTSNVSLFHSSYFAQRLYFIHSIANIYESPRHGIDSHWLKDDDYLLVWSRVSVIVISCNVLNI